MNALSNHRINLYKSTPYYRRHLNKSSPPLETQSENSQSEMSTSHKIKTKTSRGQRRGQRRVNVEPRFAPIDPRMARVGLALRYAAAAASAALIAVEKE